MKLTELFARRRPQGMPGYELVCLTDTGRVRPRNEDNFWFRGVFLPAVHGSLVQPMAEAGMLSTPVVAAVFDGMGGEQGGNLASFTAAAAMEAVLREFPFPGNSGDWTALYRTLNQKVLEAARLRQMKRMGTTAVMLSLDAEGFAVSNLGDSPAFLLRTGSLMPLHQAHTNAQTLQSLGITGRKPGLTQYLGLPEEAFQIVPHVRWAPWQPGDIFLLCSDGLTDMLSREELEARLSGGGELPALAETLRGEALERGGLDNLTLILCRVTQMR